ncbi:cell shape-determining protein MreC [mine drainage metagenome]|uniref:Cell shape-determining protein MreC n=1 Tax=mine drainage metagenome TaxID=410659 RepID=A0A1J5QM76_9ZZZZ
MAVDARLHYLTEVRQGFAALLYPLEVIAHSPVAAYEQTRDFITRQDILSQENRELRQTRLQQSVDLQRFHVLQAENDHLRQLMGAAQASPQPAKLAEIIHTGRDPFTHKVIVSLGSQQGIVAGQAAVDEYGVIGQVTQVYPFSSEVTLVTDKDLAIPIQIERNGLRAIAFGHGRDDTVDLPYLPMNVDIREGDKLVTSGIDGIYPSGLAVARVSRIERNQDSPFARIICTPTAGIESHRQILLLAMAFVPATPADSRKMNLPRPHHASRRP